MKKLIVMLLAACTTAGTMQAKESKAEKWVKSRTWAPKELKADVHPSVNAEEFMKQYNQNKELWEMAFNFLATNDLYTLPLEKKVLIPGKLIVTISEYEPKKIEEMSIEHHKKFIDLQYTLSGNEQMGYANPKTAKVIKPYIEANDFEGYADNNVKYYPADNKAFFLFFPSDLHQPSVKTATWNGEKSRKIVFKIAYTD